MRIFLVLTFSLTMLAGCSTPSTDAANSKSARVHTELAGLYFERNQYGVALEELDQALQADRSYAQAYSVRGLVHMALREDDLAEEDFKRSLNLDKNDSDTHNNYGWFLCQRGREKESIPHFMAAVKNPLYQTPGRAFLNAGLCSRKIGNNKDAEEFLQRALVLQPGMPQALLAMAELNFANGDYAAAKRYFSGYAQSSDNLTAEQLWLAVRIERKAGDRNSEASFGLQLRKRFPDARETQLLTRGE
ncbi:MAG: type IV pilus biogenesis/stability protein PilW [Gallionella sp.]